MVQQGARNHAERTIGVQLNVVFLLFCFSEPMCRKRALYRGSRAWWHLRHTAGQCAKVKLINQGASATYRSKRGMLMKNSGRAVKPHSGITSYRRNQMATVTTLTAAVLTALYGAPARADDNALQEVVVTATRRAVSAQDLPISITAVSGASLDQAGIE
jgi:hypothetical protein